MSNRPRDAKRQQREAAAARVAALRRERDAAERRRRLIYGAAVAAVVAAIVAGAVWWQSSRDETGQSAVAPTGLIGGSGFVRGPDDAPVTMVVYEDFMCPFCGNFEASTSQMLSAVTRAGTLQVQYRPISFLDRMSNGTDYSTRALNALGCVVDRAGTDAAIEMHDLLYANQPEEGSDGLSDDQLVSYATQSGATETQVRTCVEEQTYAGWVKNVTDQSTRDGVNSTPTVLINGDLVPADDTLDPAALQQAIDAATAASSN